MELPEWPMKILTRKRVRPRRRLPGEPAAAGLPVRVISGAFQARVKVAWMAGKEISWGFGNTVQR